MKILVIEDDAQAAAYLVKGLKESGHVVDHAADGKDGLFMAGSENYDVLIVDRMLPGRDGLAIVEILRGAGTETPVLFLSALGQRGRPGAGTAGGRRRLSDQTLRLFRTAGPRRGAGPAESRRR